MTEKEKAELEKIRDEWVRPPQSLIDQWNEMFGAYGKWNEDTGYFNAYDELFDITAQQAIRIINYGIPNFADRQFYNYQMPNHLIRTNAPFGSRDPNIASTLWFYNQTDLEIAFIGPDMQNYFLGVTASQAHCLFADCLNLKKILGTLKLINTIETNDTFRNCGKLEEAKIILSNVQNIYLHYCRSLNYDSYRFMVDNATNSICKIKVATQHYTALTGDAEYPFNGGTQEEWEQLLSDAAEKQITFTT